ncbi:putative arsenical pump membrane protein [Gordonia hirsuta DSM 44140 = NBRC 16056]|uniref:Putative arsenical pump membrane protein n=1 Tax=Gordonia hirsuta DSM 44140 = NBRC 16056 TaxID=1121927 RepID=L7L8F8_9ACTN|nr:putative arsenical pump membrane protein [Gordonia hirsuta DSM 44140 = NBRC 16056]
MPLIAVLATVGGLAIVSPGQAGALVLRLAPVLLFVAAMSVVVNLASAAGAFDVVAEWTRRRSWKAMPLWTATWCQIVMLALISTIFLSLDTTAILVTPLAIALSLQGGINLWPAALTVIWIANIGSLLLPVSNLTNLLAAGSGVFDGSYAYLATAWRPALVAAGVAVTASWIVYRWSSRRHVEADAVAAPADPAPTVVDRRLRASLITLGVLLPLLATGFPYWISATGAAVILVVASRGVADRRAGQTGAAQHPAIRWAALIPWASLAFVTVLSAVAAIAHTAGALDAIAGALGPRQDSTAGLLAIAGLGAATSNVVNNIPAFLALEHGVDTADGMLALLVGVNAGPLVTPWASLATLLWHDQLRRSGNSVSWRSFIAAGCVLAPIAVALPVLVIGSGS